MNSWYFWKSWHPLSRSLYWLLLLLFAAMLLYFSFHFFQSPSTVIDWQKISYVDKVKVPGENIRVGLFDFSYEFDNYVVTETFQGSEIQLKQSFMLIQLLMVALSLLILLVVCSALEGFWFYFGALILTGILISFQFEQLLLFGQSDKLGLITGMALFLSALYFFNKIRPELGLKFRFLVFGALIFVFGAFLFLFAEVAHPLVYLVNYGIVAPILLSIIFIFMMGHVFISFFLKIITRGNIPGSGNSIWHFLTISAIYLINVFLLYAHNAGYIDWDILYLDAYLILVVAAVLGIWEFKDREVQYQGLFPFAPLGAFFYLAMAIICFSTLSYIFAMANDPLAETFEDAIVFSQFSFSLLFTGYIIVNFIQPLMDNMQVYKIMYKPRNFPYGTVQIVGLIAVFAFLLNANMFPFNQAVAGYYNGVGDLYRVHEDVFVAEQYYKLGDQYGFNNHRSNYSLGALARAEGDASLAPFYFGEAVKKRPTAFAHVNLGNGLLQNEQLFDALYSYLQGLDDFENNPYLYNNLALAYGGTSLLDSALLFLDRATASPLTRQAAETNTLGLIGKNASLLQFELDSLIEEVLQENPSVPSLVNAFLLANKYAPGDEPLQDEEFQWLSNEDSVLNSYEFAYVYNYAFNRPNKLDSAQRNQLNAYTNNFANGNFYEALSVIRAWVLYQQNEVSEAMRIIDALQAMNPFQRGYYNNLLGIWALQQHAPRVAAEFLENAEKSRMEGSLFRRAVSLTETSARFNGFEDQAVAAWDSLFTLQSEGIADTNPFVNMMRQILRVVPADVSAMDDEYLYQILRYRYDDLNQERSAEIMRDIDDPNFVVLSLHDLWLAYPSDRDQTLLLINELLPQTGQLSNQGEQYLKWIKVFLLEENNDWQAIVSQLESLQGLSRWHKQLKDYYRLQHDLTGEQKDAASDLARRLIGNPFFEKGFLLALDVLYEDSLLQYQFLLKAQETNPYSTEIKQAFIITSLQAGLESYAESALEELKLLMEPQAYADFEENYQELKIQFTPSF